MDPLSCLPGRERGSKRSRVPVPRRQRSIRVVKQRRAGGEGGGATRRSRSDDRAVVTHRGSENPIKSSAWPRAADHGGAYASSLRQCERTARAWTVNGKSGEVSKPRLARRFGIRYCASA